MNSFKLIADYSYFSTRVLSMNSILFRIIILNKILALNKLWTYDRTRV